MTGTQNLFASGAPVNQPSGVVRAPDGFLYVADISASAVLRINAATGAATVVSSGGKLRSPLGMI